LIADFGSGGDVPTQGGLADFLEAATCERKSPVKLKPEICKLEH
jgi:hypothetical protein